MRRYEAQIAKDENWEIPNEIDNNISKLLKNIEEPKTVRKRPLKVAILVASLSILTITTAFAIENIIEYFNYNKNSEYISSKEELETFGSGVSLTSKDKGIEFKLDNIKPEKELCEKKASCAKEYDVGTIIDKNIYYSNTKNGSKDNTVINPITNEGMRNKKFVIYYDIESHSLKGIFNEDINEDIKGDL